MAENPLLPHRKLRDMYALMLRCRSLDLKDSRKQKGRPSGPVIAREALLAATSMHLLPGDLLCTGPGDRTAERLAPAARKTSVAAGSLVATPDLSSWPLACAAVARGLQAAGAEGLVLAYAQAGATSPGSAGWVAALEWAQSAHLPLLLACTDSGGGPATGRKARTSRVRSNEPPLDLASINRVAQRIRLPVIPVDGEDAVAIYRVMQESALRARMGGGPAVLWAMMTPLTGAGGLPRPSQPVSRLKSYLASRGIGLA